MKVVIIGGGWSGCAAAISSKKAGADVVVIEKTDLLLGLGNVGGIMRNNGRYTASEELIALGGGDLIKITDRVSTHRNIDFPGHKHATLYNVNLIEGEVRKYLTSLGIEILIESRVTDVKFDGNKLHGVYLSDGTYIEGDVFIETTGTTGPMGNCLRYGNGCSMCILRCPAFGPRISISERCGVADIQGERDDDVLGAFSGSCKLAKESLSEDIKNKLDKDGVVVLQIPKEDVNYGKLSTKVCQQYALKEFAENVVLLDTGHAKLMTTYYPLEKLRKIKGLEYAKYVDPYAGSKGNSIRYLSVAPRTNDLKVVGVDNLFCAGEKSGLFVGHTEAICTGTLAGHNAVRLVMGMSLLILPSSIAVGDIISFANEKANTREGRKNRYTFAGAGYFKRMQVLGLYTTDIDEINNRVKKINLDNIFEQRLC
ncbi:MULTISPECIES: FAD-dependent oxidoreductase [unclassified Clostridium]|uniref:Pyridine nucleotide-disulphide oxidoreductase family protein n=1 Tax=Clostridium botulinum (strain Eklund 17B / Type B) TaxID=935198 RepID=B2TQV9_CLOBB|nr:MULTISPECIES: FAD-dependent oxidoreductase [unclassified Clostridium]ACD23755.1 pyridine nucleotide-disulphide oxidoreductase family protein [Clostridium botulinum B str. Eklund 17B (NRP)]MBN1038999.1 FAD-dependent oxidoreductase [Clostridium botulinum]MBN1055779.1 FAD-dependent oxidoreductase [Clostridium botulinum]MBY6975879.1 FAD-dependent oxidoreductase [Clostridium botulinum]MBY7000302.1 FAD-dependent oxidoreductase [Clostridium botulinum]